MTNSVSYIGTSTIKSGAYTPNGLISEYLVPRESAASTKPALLPVKCKSN